MKKALLFSLLLSSTFTHIDAAEVAAPMAEQVVPASSEISLNKEEILGERSEKKHKAVDLDGKEIEVQFFDKSAHHGLVTKKLKLQDGGTYDPTGKQNFPYMAGEKMPAGAAVVYVLRKADSPDELKLVPADANIGNFPGYSANEPKEYWMYKDENNYLYPYAEEEDPNASLILNKKASVYVYEVPDFEATAQQKKITELEEKIKSGSFAAAPNESNAPAIAAAGSPFIEKFQYGEALIEGKHVNLVLTTSDPKATPENFAELKKEFLELCSAHPNVAVAIFSLALEGESVLAEGKTENLKTIRLFDKGITASLMFSSEVTPEMARAFVASLKSTSTMSKKEIEDLQKELTEKAAKAIQELEEERLQKEQMQMELMAAEEEVRKAQEETETAKVLAAKILEEADAHKEDAIVSKQIAEQTEQQLEQTQIQVVETERKLEEIASTEQQLEQENAALKGTIQEEKDEKEKIKEKLDDAHDMIGETHEALLEAATNANNVAIQQPVDQQVVVTTPIDINASEHIDSTLPIAEASIVNPSQQSLADVTRIEDQPIASPSLEEEQSIPIAKPLEDQLPNDDVNAATGVSEQQILPIATQVEPQSAVIMLDKDKLEKSVPNPLADSLAKYVEPNDAGLHPAATEILSH